MAEGIDLLILTEGSDSDRMAEFSEKHVNKRHAKTFPMEKAHPAICHGNAEKWSDPAGCFLLLISDILFAIQFSRSLDSSDIFCPRNASLPAFSCSA